MAVDIFGNWDGVCACGKKELDGIKCSLGATHLPKFRDRMTPGELAALSTPASVAAPSFPWTKAKMPWE
jgi:hypothetical protein